MKKLILLLTVFFTCLGVKAQEATTDYIYSSDGFEVKTSTFTRPYGSMGNITFTNKGLYTKDGKVLVAAISCRYELNGSTGNESEFYVIDGCETIASGAFQYQTGFTVYIPSSVKYIAPDAIVSRNNYSGSVSTNHFGGIQDGVRAESGSGAVNAPAADPNATEVARYNVQGVRLSEPTDGVNIVQMSDGTAQKVLVR